MTLFLLPNVISETAKAATSLPPGLSSIIDELDGLIAESAKEGRAYIKRVSERQVASLPLLLLNEHSQEKEIEDLFQTIKGQKWGIVSDAGLPCIADPGSLLVARARKAGIQIQAIPGPSSLFLALMLSGLTGQRFAFHGYLPRDGEELVARLRCLQKRAASENETQLFIEAPYRNDRLFQYLLQYLADTILLCVACDLTAPTEQVSTMSIKEWRSQPVPVLHKRPTVFLFL